MEWEKVEEVELEEVVEEEAGELTGRKRRWRRC